MSSPPIAVCAIGSAAPPEELVNAVPRSMKPRKIGWSTPALKTCSHFRFGAPNAAAKNEAVLPRW